MNEKELENIIDNMYELQRKRLLDIEEKGIKDLNIIDIKYVGKIQLSELEDGQTLEKEVYVSIEEKNGIISYKYFDENQKLIGIEQDEKIIGEQEKINKIKALNEETVSLNKIKETQEQEKQEEQEEKQHSDDKDKIEVPLDQNISSKVTKKEEVDLNQVQQGETLRNLLGLDGEYTKIVLVNSSQVNAFLPPEQRKSNLDCFIALKENGESIVLGEDVLQYDANSGINPQEENTTINIDGTVKQEKVTSRYKIVNGNGKQYLSVGYDESVGKEVKFSEWSNEYGKYVDTELKTSRIPEGEVNKYVREEAKRKTGIDNANEKQEKVEKKQDNGCEKTDITKVDHNPNNDSHEHITDERLQIEAKKAKVSVEEFKRIYEKAKGNTIEERIKDAHDTIEEQFIGPKQRR